MLRMVTPNDDQEEGDEKTNMVKLIDESDPHKEIHVVEELINLIKSIKLIGEYRITQNKECHDLVRRLNLFLPLLEEIRYQNRPISQKGIERLNKLKEAFRYAKKLLITCHKGSKIYLALESESIMVKLNSVYKKISRAFYDMSYDELGVAEEEREQVELLQGQMKRHKTRNATQDMELTMDIMVLCSKEDDRDADCASIERLANTLALRTTRELREETVAIRKLSMKGRGITAEAMQQLIDTLNRFKRFAGVAEDDDIEENATPKAIDKCPPLAIPHEFKCPITLEIMSDPVIISTGQTYERQSIQEWLDSNHRTCPKTGQVLSHLNMAPNMALKTLILQWCETHNIQLQQKEKPSINSTLPNENDEELSSLIQNLSDDELDVRREAVTKIRFLSKESPDNRVMIANKGAIPPLVRLLSCLDSKIQEHAVTALLNLSLEKSNKKLISQEEPFPDIIEILKSGTVGARENSAAALFSLSMLDDNKVTIGSLDGVGPLVDLLSTGTIRGKKDAITALFNLSFNNENKLMAIEEGVIEPLLEVLGDKELNMTNEIFSLLLLLASIPEGGKDIGQLSFVEMFVKFCKDGTPKNRECAAALLLELGLHNSNLILAALQFGVYDHIAEIAKSGTNRAQRKANAMLQLMNRAEQI